MSKHSDLYNQVREEIARWPQWKINAYNEMFATSAHAEKVTPHAPTNADRIRAMSDEKLAEFLSHHVYYSGMADKVFTLRWLRQPLKEE